MDMVDVTVLISRLRGRGLKMQKRIGVIVFYILQGLTVKSYLIAAMDPDDSCKVSDPHIHESNVEQKSNFQKEQKRPSG
ncbi:hypothetical protein EGT74_13665 [Chitinophaga lutea]|uniref:Uncharacterized protein n=1 Tax=Chitinophaga lutea TaxID=2488634 RepID=A0A3N4PSX8_9BACT|nr:hypothetical protein EGT74_13665 [Chitinophaga lutea]